MEVEYAIGKEKCFLDFVWFSQLLFIYFSKVDVLEAGTLRFSFAQQKVAVWLCLSSKN